MNNKSYKPFKMLGSWVGFMTSFILLVSFNPTGDSLIERIANRLTGYGMKSSAFKLDDFFISWTILITGFLIGWGIHSLIRKFRN